MEVILGSQSPRRRELMAGLDIPFTAITIEPDNGVGGYQYLLVRQLTLVRTRLRTRDIIRNIAGLQLSRIGLIGIDVDSRKRQV